MPPPFVLIALRGVRTVNSDAGLQGPVALLAFLPLDLHDRETVCKWTD
jgi:hypothetical protein